MKDRVFSGLHKYRALIISLSAIVVFITTYLLILPALTLDREEAQHQGGIIVPAEDSEQVSDSVYEAGELTFNGKGYDIQASYGEEAEILSDTELKVEEIGSKSALYQHYYDTALQAVQKSMTDYNISAFSFARFYNISMVSDKKETQPSDQVRVSISYDQGLAAENADHVQIIHFEKDHKTGNIEPVVLGPEDVAVEIEKDKMTEASFKTKSFSVFAVVYTVEFHWQANGKTYDFEIPGGGFVSLSQLMEKLDINKQDNMPSLTLSDVENVTFSHPDLIWTGKAEKETTVGELIDSNGLNVQYSADVSEEQKDKILNQKIEAGDWALISLQPFDTEETLNITMKNGDEFTVKVTDSSYTSNDITDQVLDGHTGALVNPHYNNALQSSRHRENGRLSAVRIVYDQSAHTISTVNAGDRITEWTFTKVNNTNLYYIHSSAGYLNMNINGNSGLTVSETPQPFTIERNNSNGTIRIKHQDNNNAVNLFQNNTNNGYGVWGGGDINNQGEQFKLIELSNKTETIALNPMNENGVLPNNPDSGNVTSTHYKNMTIDGHTITSDNDLQYSRIYIPVEYKNDGTATITLPSNDQLGGFRVSEAEDSSVRHSIVQDPNKYQWVLKGWVNIADGSYYDVTNGSATATVKNEDLNVFYADWAPAPENYNHTISNTINTADTSSFVTIGMWDYNELYNLKSGVAYKVDGDQARHQDRDTITSEEWYLRRRGYVQFVDNTDSSNCWQYGTLGNEQGRGAGGGVNSWSNYSGWHPTFGITGQIGEPSSTGVLTDLFSTANTPGSGVTYLGEANYLFSYDSDKMEYSYDSQDHGAVYNQSAQRFYVAQNPSGYYTNAGLRGGFLPLNEYYALSNGSSQTPLRYNNGTINYWFGMKMDIQFWLPDAPGSGGNLVGRDNDHMRFTFRGDDDVWVFIDDKLALDIGGIHEALNGYIDFTTGDIVVQYGDWGHEQDTRVVGNLSDMGIDAGAHKLSFYYMERGANASNCEIAFNLMPRWVQDPVEVNTAKVTKTWSDNTPEEKKTSLRFQLKTVDTVVDTVDYDRGTITADGKWTYVWEGLDPDKNYVVQEIADPAFDASITHQTIEDATYEYWAHADYSDENAFGTGTILIGNGSDTSGRLLNSNSNLNSVEAVISNDVVHTESVSDSVKWTVEGYTSTSMHFYLKNNEGKYLSIRNGSLVLVDNQTDASWFYMGPTGDLNDAETNYRVIVDPSSGSITVGQKKGSDAAGTESQDRVHIYEYQTITTKTFDYQVVNTLKVADMTMIKVDKKTGRPIGGAKFSLQKDGENVGFANLTITAITGGAIIAPEDYDLNGTTIKVVTIPEDGIKIAGLVDGTYVLTERVAPDGYIITDNDKTFKVENGELKNADDSAHQDEAEGISFKVENESGAELPYTGGSGTWFYRIFGMLLIAGAGAWLVIRRRKVV